MTNFRRVAAWVVIAVGGIAMAHAQTWGKDIVPIICGAFCAGALFEDWVQSRTDAEG